MQLSARRTLSHSCLPVRTLALGTITFGNAGRGASSEHTEETADHFRHALKWIQENAAAQGVRTVLPAGIVRGIFEERPRVPAMGLKGKSGEKPARSRHCYRISR